LFAAKGTGANLDKLAQEMAETGMIARDGGADALWGRPQSPAFTRWGFVGL